MSDWDFERKHEEDLQRLRGLRLLDDDFMNKVFEDTACAEFLLQIIFAGLTFLSVDPNMLYVIKGLIILVACAIDMRKYLVRK